MKITKNIESEKLTIALEGRLDTQTAPELEAELNSSLAGIKELVVDLSALDYISSAGLRVMLFAKKKMDTAGGSMKVIGVNESVNEVFEITGFSEILDIELKG